MNEKCKVIKVCVKMAYYNCDKCHYLEVFSGNFINSIIRGSISTQAGVWYPTAVQVVLCTQMG